MLILIKEKVLNSISYQEISTLRECILPDYTSPLLENLR